MMNQSNVKRAVDMITKIPLPKQRIYHAGGMADVVKMSFLSRLLSHTKAGYALGNTPAFTYLDLFGGKGLYDLSKSTAKDQAALKRYWTHVRGGFRKSFTPGWPFYPFVNVVNLAHANPSLTAPPPRKPLMAHPQIPASPLEVPIKGHVETLKSAQRLENPKDHLPSYTFLADQAAPLSPLDIPLPKQLSVFPGGPFAAKAFMRPRDQAIIVEQDTASFNELKSVLKADKDSRIELINADPEAVLNRVVPPRTAGGVVYMDMGHNLDGEHMAKMQRLFTPAIKAWPVATYVITYPIIDARPFDLLEDVVRTGARYCLNVEVYNNFADTSDGQERGVGIAIVNPPPEFLQEARMMTYELQNIFNVPELSEQARPATAAWMVNGGNVDYEWPDRFKLNMKYKPGLDEMVLRREVFDLPTQKPEDDPKYADLLKRQGKRMFTKEKKIRGMQDKYNATAPGSKEEAQHDWRWFRKGQLPIQPIVPDNYPESFAEQVKLFSSTSAADWRAFRKARIEAEDRRLGGALTAKAPNRKR